MKTPKHRISTVIVIVLAIVLTSPQLLALAASTDFENFANGTPAASLNVPGVTFSGPYNITPILAGFTDIGGRGLATIVGGTLTLTFTGVQSQIAFGWSTNANSVTVNGFRGASNVYTQTFSGAAVPGFFGFFEGRAVVNASVDRIVVTYGSGISAFDNLSSSAGSATGAQFFDPADNRVDGRPGDRMAVYCLDEKTIQVIGVGADGKGAGYTIFKVAEVIAAGKPGKSAALRSYVDPKANLGIVSIQIVLIDGGASVYAAWNGGILNATGQGDFRKQFSTPIQFCPFTYR